MNDLTGKYTEAVAAEMTDLFNSIETDKTNPMHWFVVHGDDDAFYGAVPKGAEELRAEYQRHQRAMQPA